MMEGKPHITSNNGAQTEYIRDGRNAIFVEPGNHFALAAAINHLIDDPKARQRIGNQAKIDFDSDLNYDIFYDKITRLYNDLFKVPVNQVD